MTKHDPEILEGLIDFIGESLSNTTKIDEYCKQNNISELDTQALAWLHIGYMGMREKNSDEVNKELDERSKNTISYLKREIAKNNSLFWKAELRLIQDKEYRDHIFRLYEDIAKKISLGI